MLAGAKNKLIGSVEIDAAGSGCPGASIAGYEPGSDHYRVWVSQSGELSGRARRDAAGLAAGGALAILEFTQPPNKAFAAVYNWYSRRVLPILGGAISGAPEAYQYLPESVRKFPEAGGLADIMRESGYDRVEWNILLSESLRCT